MSCCRAQTKPLSEVGSHVLLPILHLREHSTDEIISGMHLRQIYLLQSRRPAQVLDTGLVSACGRQHYFLVSKKIPFPSLSNGVKERRCATATDEATMARAKSQVGLYVDFLYLLSIFGPPRAVEPTHIS